MGYDGKILARATELFKVKITRHERELDLRAARLAEQYPRLGEIDIALRRTVIHAINAALSAGADVGAEVRKQQARNRALQEERAAILQENGYPANFLNRDPMCPCCADTGYTEAGMCTCLRSIYLEEQHKELQYSTGLPAMYLHKIDFSCFADEHAGNSRITVRENMQYAVHVCRNFIDLHQGRTQLFFSGPPGTGKTYMAVALAHSAADRGISVVYESAGRLLSRYEDMRFHREDETAKDDISRCENCDLLILDDLGTEMVTSVTTAGLYQLINTRMTAGKGGVFLSNLTHEDLCRRYPPQILSRLEGECEVLRFFGNDLRQNKRANFY